MKRRLFSTLIIGLAVTLMMVFTTSQIFAAKKKPVKATSKTVDVSNKKKSSTKKIAPGPGTARMPSEANPYPVRIYASQCPCKASVEPAGGILMNGVYVELRSRRCGVRPRVPVSGKVRFKYYSVKDNRWRQVVKSFTNLTDTMEVMMIAPGNPILASKSHLLIAEIFDIRGARDCDSNNTLRIATCVLPPLI